MLKQERISFRRKIETDHCCGAEVFIDFSNISKEERDQIEKVADDFLDLVTEILEKRNKEKNTATLGYGISRGVNRVEIDEALEHFRISNDDLKSAELFRCNNSVFFREKTGVDQALGAAERLAGKKIKKARIIIDYDANFPSILTRVISQ